MKANFVVNEYALIWYLLFQASISENIYKLKQKLWDTYKIEYNNTYKDRELILKEKKDFIPNDDTIYNIIMENKYYEKIKKNTDKYRLEVMKLWDKNKKVTNNFYENIFRKEINDLTFFVVSDEVNVIDYDGEDTLVVGKVIDKKNPYKILLDININIVVNNIKKYSGEEHDFMKAIVELAVLNEYASELNGFSCYLSGDPELIGLKRWLYPYFLMYIGVPKDKLNERMMRDKITFDIDEYAYEKELHKLNIEEFIDFCIRNKKYIIRENRKRRVMEDII